MLHNPYIFYGRREGGQSKNGIKQIDWVTFLGEAGTDDLHKRGPVAQKDRAAVS
jgi:hypothetical protein